MTTLQFLKKVRKGLTNPKNFDGTTGSAERPHCLIGEWEFQNRKNLTTFRRWDILTQRDQDNYTDVRVTHKTVLSILDRAIKHYAKFLLLLLLLSSFSYAYEQRENDNDVLLAGSMAQMAQERRAYEDRLDRQMEEQQRQFESNQADSERKEVLKEMQRHNRCMECRSKGPDAVCLVACE